MNTHARVRVKDGERSYVFEVEKIDVEERGEAFNERADEGTGFWGIFKFFWWLCRCLAKKQTTAGRRVPGGVKTKRRRVL